jgi:hypothetical protein
MRLERNACSVAICPWGAVGAATVNSMSNAECRMANLQTMDRQTRPDCFIGLAKNILLAEI